MRAAPHPRVMGYLRRAPVTRHGLPLISSSAHSVVLRLYEGSVPFDRRPIGSLD